MALELTLKTGRVQNQRVEGAKYPPVVGERRSNPQIADARLLKTATKPRLLKEPSPASTPTGAGDPDPRGNPDPVTFNEYRDATTGTRKLTDAADMSGADSERNTVMMSGNWYCDVSNDGGATWRRLDPTTIFPQTLGKGFCCDQVVTYVAAIDRFVWFLQYQAKGGQGAFRIASASSKSVHDDPTAWTYWDFLAGDFGYAKSDMDYPDLSFSTHFLYVGTDVFNAGRLAMRIPLKEIAAGGTINFDYTDAAKSKNQWGAHLVQQTASAMIWAGHKNNSTIEIFVMPDAGSTYSWFSVPVSSWPNGTHDSKGPDGNDWLTKLDNFPQFAITGGVERLNGNVVLAWSASKGKGSGNGFNFPQTHCRVVEVNVTTRSIVSEMQVWNPDYAFAYPALALNSRDEVGIFLGWGGKDSHANCAMGIIGDFVVWFRDGSTRTVQRFGDYLTTRRAERNHGLYSGFGYFVTTATAANQCTYNPFYVRYGRSSV